MTSVQHCLYSLQDEGYRAFQAKLIPHYPVDKIIGVRIPALRKVARQLCDREGEAQVFLDELPHGFHEENYLHALILNRQGDFDVCAGRVEAFLPFLDNWQITDALRPAVFAQDKGRLLHLATGWVATSEEYICRFGLEMLMVHFLDDSFDEQVLEIAAGAKATGYYAQMAQAWFFAEGLAAHWESTLKVIEAGRLEPWVHNKAIQKARESYKVTEDHKAHLVALKIVKRRS